MFCWLKKEYNNPPVFITENGYSDSGEINDVRRVNYYKVKVSLKVGRMTMHAHQIGPTDIAPPCPGSPHQVCVGARGNALGQATFLPPLLHCLLGCADGATTLPFLDPGIRY